MPRISEWTASMVGAWQYALSAVDRGMSGSEGLADYRAGGGSIRTQDWYSLTRLANETVETGEMVTGLPFETPIPGNAYSIVEMDYGQKYVVTSEISYIDAATGETVTRTVTVESDEIRSWSEIEDEIEEVGAAYGVVGGIEGITIGETNYYSPKWIEW